jgi:hypothetical protein
MLSAYLEDSISPEEKGLIDEHLKVCGKCNESLVDLRKTLVHLRNLEEIEPPPWLIRKVMTTIKSEAEARRGILRRLFYPLHIKVPIEALATILIAVTAIYVFKTMEPEVRLAKAPPAEMKPRALLQEKEGAEVLDKPAKQSMVAEEREIPVGKREEAPRAPARIAKRDEVVPSADVAAKRESKTKALSPELRAARIERRRKGLGLTIIVEEIGTAREAIERALVQTGGKIIKTGEIGGKNVIVAELQSEKMKELLEELKLIGEMREKGLVLEDREGNIEVRIEILGK